ncbi:MAG: hypothetical protein KIT87_08050 [Anaerolineae bacterium]|nr:hypothetical protein [Anaerolineae bacterium]
MASSTMAGRASVAQSETAAFERLAGLCAILAGVAIFLYSIGFIILRNDLVYSIFQMLGGLLVTAAIIAVYERVRQASGGFALWGVALWLVGTLGSTVHGGYDLANALNPPASNAAALANLPSQVDPRGLLTFGVVGLGLLVVSWLMTRTAGFPRNLGYLGYLLAALSLVLYLGRLIVLNATSPLILYPALLTGFVVNPLWHIWLGLTLWRGR